MTRLPAAPSPCPPNVKAKLPDGKKGLIVGIANEPSIASDCAKAFERSAQSGYPSQRQSQEICRAARARARAPIFMPLDVCMSGQMEFERIAKTRGELRAWTGIDQAANSFRIDKCQKAQFITSYFYHRELTEAFLSSSRREAPVL
jgi:enoyl-[acyl-carrier-protein] reductase (NADH)